MQYESEIMEHRLESVREEDLREVGRQMAERLNMIGKQNLWDWGAKGNWSGDSGMYQLDLCQEQAKEINEIAQDRARREPSEQSQALADHAQGLVECLEDIRSAARFYCKKHQLFAQMVRQHLPR